MRPIFHDYEYFEPAFNEILTGIKEMIKQKLWYLKDCKWRFKGWVTHPEYRNIKYELKYDDNNTEESYCIKGNCEISKRLLIKDASIEFDVIEERTQKEICFKVDFDDKESLIDIEDAINAVIVDNRSYRYFCEDYDRYMKHNPFQYIKSLLSDHLINIEEEVYDDGCGTTYHYTGEFGEDLLEIVIDDSDFDEEENMDICDFIHVNVCDRFHFEFSEYNSREIRSLVSLLKPVTIPINDFLIRTDTMHCIHKNHHLHRIKALICLDTGDSVKEVATEALYCQECNHYFISELEYEKLCKQGRVCSRVITLIEYKKISESGYHSWAKKSLLRSYGYTVNVQDNLSDDERHRILSFVIENDIMSVDEAVSFIEWLINRNSNKDFYNARLKWMRDIQFLRNYKPVKGIIRVKDIYRKKYISK